MQDRDATRAPPGRTAGGEPETPGFDHLPDHDPKPPIDLHRLAQDWITLWQSELTAAAADRELQETWQTMAALWASAAATMLRALPRAAPGPGEGGGGRWPGPGGAAGGGSAGAAVPPRTTPAAAAPDPRDAEIDRLARRIADLERRLAGLERGGG